MSSPTSVAFFSSRAQSTWRPGFRRAPTRARSTSIPDRKGRESKASRHRRGFLHCRVPEEAPSLKGPHLSLRW
jgi:hypothetical protein